MIIDDIEGTRSKVDSKIPKRDPISVKDILGAQNRVPYQRKSLHDSMHYKDVFVVEWESKR
jgi:hypothetical protein